MLHLIQILSQRYVNKDYGETQRVLNRCRKLQITNEDLRYITKGKLSVMFPKQLLIYVTVTAKENGTIAIALARHQPMF